MVVVGCCVSAMRTFANLDVGIPGILMPSAFFSDKKVSFSRPGSKAYQGPNASPLNSQDNRRSAVIGCASPLVFLDYCACPIQNIGLSPLNVSCSGIVSCVTEFGLGFGRTMRGVSIFVVENVTGA